MFAAITRSELWNYIERAVSLSDGEFIYKKIGQDIDIADELERVSRIPVGALIIDILSIANPDDLPRALRNYRIKRDGTRIIIIAPDYTPGNKLISSLVAIGVYDIINPSSEKPMEFELSRGLLECLSKAPSYGRAAKWDLAQNVESNDQTKNETDLGTKVIAVAGTMPRIGTTHTALSIAKYLADRRFGVAIMELHDSNAFTDILNSHGNRVPGIDFYPYKQGQHVADALSQEYDYLVLDLGVYKSCDLQEFWRSHEKILVSGVKDWELGSLEEILKAGDRIFKIKYYFTLSDKDTFKYVKANMEKLDCYQAPYSPQPFAKNAEADKVIGELVHAGTVLARADGSRKNRPRVNQFGIVLIYLLVALVIYVVGRIFIGFLMGGISFNFGSGET